MAKKVLSGPADPVYIVGGTLSASTAPPVPVLASNGNVNQPAVNTAAQIIYQSIAGVPQVIAGVAWGYDGDPTGGSLTIDDGTDTLFYVPITKGGPGYFQFNPPMRSGVAGFRITLAAGGAGITGSLSVLGHWEVA